MGAVEDRIAALGLTLPEVAVPVAAYVPAVVDGSRVYVSGQVPMVGGKLVATGHVGELVGLVPPDRAKELAAVCALNALAAIKSVVGDLDRVERIVKVTGFVASDPSFTGQPGVVSTASTLTFPLDGHRRFNVNFLIEGQPPAEDGAQPLGDLRSASADYFPTLGIPLVTGRLFTPSDGPDAPQVAIVNQALARRYFSRETAVGKRIDAVFENSPSETKTVTEKALAQGFADQIGNIGLIIQWILAAVFFTLLLVIGNTMAQSVRERTSELAVLKTLGFSNEGVLGLVLAESALLAVVGGALGLGIGNLVIAAGDPTGGFLPVFYFPERDQWIGAVFVLALGFLAGILPAVQAMRLRIVDALRRA